ncbi:hypothetical protein J6590_062076 [Homalodisca vitripennis]|nr:hypothetical protein J6590_062076 [Homalodisca vitripennis]
MGFVLGTPNEDVVTKSMYRFKVWNLLENKDLVRFPRPCKGRIPNFVDCVVAAEKLSALDIFKKAEIIKVNIDKPQESVRFTVLEEGKTLLVPMPGLTDGLVMKVTPPRDASRPLLRMACKRRGASDFGKPIDLNEKIQVDMIVLGSVAVSKEVIKIQRNTSVYEKQIHKLRAKFFYEDLCKATEDSELKHLEAIHFDRQVFGLAEKYLRNKPTIIDKSDYCEQYAKFQISSIRVDVLTASSPDREEGFSV